MSSKLAYILVLSLTGGLFSSPALAYLDPATGSILLQGLLALIAGVAVTTKLYWNRLKSYFTRRTPTPATSNPNPDSSRREHKQ